MTALLSSGIHKYISEHKPENIIFPLEKAKKLALKAGIKMIEPCEEKQEYGMDNEVKAGNVLFYTGEWPGSSVRTVVEFYGGKIEITWKVTNISSIIDKQYIQKVEYQPHFINISEDSHEEVLLHALHIKNIIVKLSEFAREDNKNVVGFPEPDWKKVEIAGFPYPIPKWYCFEEELEEYADSLQRSYGTRHGPLGDDEL